MNLEAQVRAAIERKRPGEALLALARAVDALQAQDNTAADWGLDDMPGTYTYPQPENIDKGVDPGGVSVTEDGGDIEVSLPVVPDHVQADRYAFAKDVLRLHEALPDVEDVLDVYAKGGPLWLYYGNRALTMSYPYDIKQRMVLDVEATAPQEAHDMGRDILKDPTANAGISRMTAEVEAKQRG